MQSERLVKVFVVVGAVFLLAAFYVLFGNALLNSQANTLPYNQANWAPNSCVQLSFEQSGPSNGTLAPFVIEPGPIEQSDRDTVYVTAATYANILLHIGQVLSRPSALLEQHLFDVQCVRGDNTTVLYQIADNNMAIVIDDVLSMFAAEREQAPAFLPDLKAMLGVKR
jgi:hypothetical protein